MKLIRFGLLGSENPGIILNEEYYDVSSIVNDYDEHFFSTDGIALLKNAIAEKNPAIKKISKDIRLGCPVSKPSKIVCIGLNYADHARETGVTAPEEPVIFLKSTTAIVGPNDAIIIPKNSTKTDWEVELAVVVGKKASYVDEEHAHEYIAGYCLHNDVSERAFQLERSGTWDKGKGCDSFAPIGPFIATADEINNVNDLHLWLKVNGQMMQDSNTSNMIFKIPFLISYISQFMTLLPGDIISTGTPHGVGLAMKPATYLNAGDIVELGIDGLGSAIQQVKKYN
jgi:2-keto-4-pentenoate hydratase/2-oxohepta-3-ene-1,7-dioic acid hydratase in catechol pathway